MPVKNLVVAGAATHGPGVEAVVISGACAAEALRPGLLSQLSSTARHLLRPILGDHDARAEHAVEIDAFG